MSAAEQRRQAEARMATAKRQFTEAARSALGGNPEAPHLARKAYAEVTLALVELHALDAGRQP